MDRRIFLATIVSTSMTAAARSNTSPELSGAETDVTGLTKSTIPTPALIVDQEAFDANLITMAEHCRQAKRQFRPHVKTHKCSDIARRQIAAGAIGVCVATVSEAEAMVAAGITGVLLTSPIVDPLKITRMVRLVRQCPSVMLAVDSSRQAELLASAATAADLQVDVLVDIDIGDRRTGVLPGQPAVDLAQQIAKCKQLQVVGVQAYAGHASHVVGYEARDRVSREALGKAVETRRLLLRSGFDARILSGGSSGTYNIDSTIDGVTELQVGSYIFMDVDYRRIGSRDGNPIYSDFRPSLTVLTTVINATHADRVTIDAGTKSIDTTTTQRAEPKNWPGLIYTKAGDEFGAISFEADARRPTIGDRIEFIVPHCDPSVNLYDRLYVCRGDAVTAVWKTSARRE
ncbi:MAG: DSD1 family PLP-dependent enzyme [Planctomycetaceae bacterium]